MSVAFFPRFSFVFTGKFQHFFVGCIKTFQFSRNEFCDHRFNSVCNLTNLTNYKSIFMGSCEIKRGIYLLIFSLLFFWLLLLFYFLKLLLSIFSLFCFSFLLSQIASCFLYLPVFFFLYVSFFSSRSRCFACFFLVFLYYLVLFSIFLQQCKYEAAILAYSFQITNEFCAFKCILMYISLFIYTLRQLFY